MGAEDKAARRKAVQAAARESKSREQRVDRLLWIGGVGGAIAILLALAYLANENLTKSQSVEYLDASDTETLQSVLFGGAPWLLLCRDSPKALKDDQLREPFVEAGIRLLNQDVAKTGVLDCSHVLPSGSTIYERLALNTTRGPVLFLAQGGDRPLQLDPKLLKKTSTSATAASKKRRKSKTSSQKKTTETAGDPSQVPQGLELTKAVKDRVSNRYRLTHIKDTDTFTKHCLQRKQCALFLGYGDPLYSTKTVAKTLRQDFPLLRWAHLDRSKYTLSTEKQMLETEKAPRKKQQLVLYQKGSFRVFSPSDVQHTETEIREFLKDTLASNGKFNSPIKDKVKVTRKPVKRPEQQASPADSRAKSRKAAKKSSSTAAEEDVSTVRMTPEEAEEERLRREHQRRKEMEQDAQEFEPVFIEEEESDDGEVSFGDDDNDDDDGEGYLDGVDDDTSDDDEEDVILL